MKILLNVIDVVLKIIMIIWDIIELLTVPAIFVVIGLLNAFPWQYYAISIGGYVVLLILAEITAHFVLKALDKKYTPFIERKFEEIFNSFSKKADEE